MAHGHGRNHGQGCSHDWCRLGEGATSDGPTEFPSIPTQIKAPIAAPMTTKSSSQQPGHLSGTTGLIAQSAQALSFHITIDNAAWQNTKLRHLIHWSLKSLIRCTFGDVHWSWSKWEHGFTDFIFVVSQEWLLTTLVSFRLHLRGQLHWEDGHGTSESTLWEECFQGCDLEYVFIIIIYLSTRESTNSRNNRRSIT